MTEPEFDAQGYPTEATLEFIRKAAGDWNDFMSFIKQAWRYRDYFRARTVPGKGTAYILHTGGFSGNEEIIAAMEQNTLFMACCWQKSVRGGRHTFFVPL